MSSAPLTQTEIAGRLRNENLDEWLELLWATQGTAKRKALELMAAILPFPIEEELFVLDLCCGPGDVGRVIRSRFSIARIDCVDRVWLHKKHELDPNRLKIFAVNSQLGPGSQAQSYTPVGAGTAFNW